MFAPTGYLRFGEIWEEARQIARDLCWAQRSYRFDGDNFEGVRVEQTPMERDAVQCWLLSRFLNEGIAEICSPQGVVYAAPPILAHHLDQLEMLDCPIPIEDSSLEIPKTGESFEVADAYYFSSRFIFVDVFTGCIKRSAEIKIRDQDISGFSVKSQAYIIEKNQRIADAFGPYAGWSICVREKVFDTTVAEVQRLFGLRQSLVDRVNKNSAAPMFFDDQKPRGRPRKRENARGAYEALFPNGHEKAGVTFKEATNMVSSELGVEVADRTLRRALDERG